MSARVIVTYGHSNRWKSTNLAFAAQWLSREFGRPVRLITVESSSQDIFEPLVRAGMVQVASFIRPQNPLVTLGRLAKGYWIKANEVGKPEAWLHPDLAWDDPKPCAYLIEGLTSIADLLMEDVTAKNRKIAQDVVGAFEEGCTCGVGYDEFRDADGTLQYRAKGKHKEDCKVMRFAASAKAHYNFVQKEVLSLLRAFSDLPVPYVIASAHETQAHDKSPVPKSIVGPALVGDAKTWAVIRACSTMIHYERFQPAKNVYKVRCWFLEHPDSEIPGLMCHAKVTLLPPLLKKLLAKYPNGYFEPTAEHGLDEFLQTEHELLTTYAETLTAEEKGIRSYPVGADGVVKLNT